MIDLKRGEKVFLIGIGGVGMSAIAVILKKRGFLVSGSDRSESAVTKNLEKSGITVKIGHKSENITDDTSVIVYTNAISEDNPEFLRAKELQIPVFERARMLDWLALPKFTIGVSGTHGKTTTTSMVAKIFLSAGMDPTLAVGGNLKEIDGSGYDGKGNYFIYEACEAYSSFLRLHPNMALITNIDADHLDYYHTFKNVKLAFDQYIRENIPPHGVVVYNKDDAPLRRVVRNIKGRQMVSVGIKKHDADFVAEKVQLNDFSSSFSVLYRGRPLGEFYVNIPGRHNVTNALLAIAACKLNGISMDFIAESLANFKNADRRFQVKFNTSELTVIDDYAHHPAEIDATLSAARNLSSRNHAQLIAIFQPHLYSRTELLYKDFARSLSKADRVVLTEIYAAREVNVNNISTKMIYDEIVKLKGADNVIYLKELSEVPDRVKLLLNGKNVVVTLGAGDVWKVSDMFGCH